MIMNNAKTILFASLIAVIMLPSMISDAEATETVYTRTQVDKAFYNLDEYLVFDKQNKMRLDMSAMLKDRVFADGKSLKDIRIVAEYMKLNNDLISASISGDQDKIEKATDDLLYGEFKYVFNDPKTSEKSSRTNVYWLGETACGITNGDTSTYPPTPTIYIGEDGHDSQESIEDELKDQGLHYVSYPYADWGDIVYAEVNLTDTTGCDEGEFRDEHHVYPDTVTHNYGDETTSGWHELIQYNEPNPETILYPSPTYWWNGFVYYWHDNF